MFWAKVVVIIIPLLLPKVKHEFHSSLAEMNYNSTTASLEVSLRVFSDDFVLAINEKNGTKFTEESILDPKAEKFIRQYITRHLSIVSPEKEVKVGEFIGAEAELDATWLYIEFKNCKNLAGHSIFNSILVDLFDDQTNIINVIYPSDRKSLIFTKSKKVQAFPF